MITKELCRAEIAEMKRVYEAYRPLLCPNRKSGAEVDAYFRCDYLCQPLDDCAFKNAAAADIMENEHFYITMQSGIQPKVRCYRTGDVFVGIDLISGGFHVEAADMATAVPIYDDLFAFRGLDEDDLNNFILVAEYMRLMQK